MKIQFPFEHLTAEVQAQNIKGTLWLHVNGRTFVYESEAQKKRQRSKSGGASTGLINSPMPGKITKIFKKLGDEVKAGEAILVMEAMKMEYTLKADVAGSLKSLDCQLGDQVALGKKLAQVQPSTVEKSAEKPVEKPV